MKKFVFLTSLLAMLVLGLDSCKKCYICTQTAVVSEFNVDSTVILKSEQCSGKNGAGANLKVAIADIESTGYICKPE